MLDESYGAIFTTRAEEVWFLGTCLVQLLVALYLRIRHPEEWEVQPAMPWSSYWSLRKDLFDD